MHQREAVSAETLQRAIKARLVIQHGASNPCAAVRLPIELTAISDNGVNWQLAAEVDAVAPCRPALFAAAASVAAVFNLKDRTSL